VFLSESDRDRIIRTAAELCAEVGYEEMLVERVAERANVSAEHFRELFDGKEAVVRSAVDAILAAVVALVGELYEPDRPEPESYLLTIKAILELMADNPEFALISYVGARQMMPPELKQQLDSGSGLLTAMLERLSPYSRADVQPSRAGRAALGGAEAVVRQEVTLGRAANLPWLLPDFFYAATVPFLGQQEALRLARRGRELLVGPTGGS